MQIYIHMLFKIYNLGSFVHYRSNLKIWKTKLWQLLINYLIYMQ